MKKVEEILSITSKKLKNIDGITGVVLGGSRAKGTHSQDSDIDIGIYYDSESNLDIKRLNEVASELDDNNRKDIIAPFGTWGEWINSGGWLVIDGHHVDFILRDIKRVETVINDCFEGKITSHYQAGHIHGYINAMYMGELAISKILYDRYGRVSDFKKKVENYPIKMKQAVIGYFSFEAEFSYMFANANVVKDDIYYVIGHIVRSISCLNQVLFAVNDQYCINEKKAVKMINTFKIKPVNYKEKVDNIFKSTNIDLKDSCEKLRLLIDEVNEIIK